MKRKMMRYAMLYISELAEDTFPGDETITPEKFMEITGMYRVIVIREVTP